MWSCVDDIRTPLTLEANLEDIYDDPRILVDLWKSTAEIPSPVTDSSEKEQGLSSEFSNSVKSLHIPADLPTAITELQQQFFLDFVFLWRSWIDDPYTWHYGSHVFNAFMSATLRLASWDFEVSKDCDVPLPVSHSSIPSWHFPTEEIYWFHGFLIILHPHLDTTQGLRAALSRAKAFIDLYDYTTYKIYSIFLSPHQIAFAEISQRTTIASEPFPLLADYSASRCCAGFRMLAQVLSSGCWKKPYMETWGFPLPPEIILEVLHHSEPRDTVSFARASFLAERCYYVTVPQLGGVSVPELKLSIPCCGDRTDIEKSGLQCKRCYSWQHQGCIGLESLPATSSYTCATCSREDPNAKLLHAGGINTLDGRSERRACLIKIDGSVKALRVRTSKPANSRPELRIIGDLIHKIPKGLIDFVIRFNGVFSGLSYGMDDIKLEEGSR